MARRGFSRSVEDWLLQLLVGVGVCVAKGCGGSLRIGELQLARVFCSAVEIDKRGDRKCVRGAGMGPHVGAKFLQRCMRWPASLC